MLMLHVAFNRLSRVLLANSVSTPSPICLSHFSVDAYAFPSFTFTLHIFLLRAFPLDAFALDAFHP